MFDFLWKRSKERATLLSKVSNLEEELAQVKAENDALKSEASAFYQEMLSPRNKKEEHRPRKISRGCGKRCYTSSKKAKQANRKNNHRLKAYLCDICQAWHVAKGK